MDSKFQKFFNVQDKAILSQSLGFQIPAYYEPLRQKLIAEGKFQPSLFRPGYEIKSAFDPRVIAVRTRKAKEAEMKEVKEEVKEKPKLLKIKKEF